MEGSAYDYGLAGTSSAIATVRRMIEKAARTRLPVLLLGESGTGKEVAARAIYNLAPRGQFVPIDCGSLVGTLMESELFGHTKGSFSGAIETKKGLVEQADGGTAFFDEIGDLPLEMQVKLLRLLQEREFRPVGAPAWRKVDLRIIAATHRVLKDEVAAHRFRGDLFFRLNVFTIHLPTLRERRQDIPLLVERFLGDCRAMGLPAFEPPPDVMAAFVEYDWPGNVRELKHAIERMSAMYSEGGQALELPSAIVYQRNATGLHSLSEAVDEEHPAAEFRLAPATPVVPLPQVQRRAISHALGVAGGVKGKAAKMLGIGRTTLYRKMKEYGIE
jgi:DNA-binding NtrC family response regulator